MYINHYIYISQVKSLPEFKELRQRFLEEIFNTEDDNSTLISTTSKVRNFASRSYNFDQQVGQQSLNSFQAIYSKNRNNNKIVILTKGLNEIELFENIFLML